MSSRSSSSGGGRRQGIFWMLTIPHHGFTPYLPTGVRWIKGQLERGEGNTGDGEISEGSLRLSTGEGGYLHWQIVLATSTKSSLAQIVGMFGAYHAELTRSDAAEDYVWKEETCVDPSTRFEFGVKPFQRNSSREWEVIWNQARSGDLESIPADVRVVNL